MTRRFLWGLLLAVALSALGADSAHGQLIRCPSYPPPPDGSPVRNLSPPAVYGPAVEGGVLASHDGVWSGRVLRMTRRWQRFENGCWVDIAGATASTYVPTAWDIGRRLRLRVSATGFTGTAVEARSEPTAAVTSQYVPAPTPTPTPTATPTPTPTATPSAPAPLAELPLIAFPTATVAGTGLATATLQWGERPEITGRLARPGGRPVPRAGLTVTSRLDMPGAAPVRLGQVRTDTRGAFRYTPPTGPSRTITFGFTDAAALRTASVILRVIPRISLRVSARVSITGRVTGAPAGVRKLVELQASNGRSWHTFATTRTAAAGGTFTHRARLPGRPIRALVRAEPGWPFLTGTSPPATARR